MPAPSPVYILAGPETGLKDSFVAEVLAAVRADGEPDFYRLYADDTPPSSLAAMLRNGSLFASWIVIEYRNVDQLSKKEDIQVLADYCSQPADHTILLLETDGYGVPKPIEAKVPASCRKTFFEMFESELGGWIRRTLRSSGIDIDDAAVESILELVPHESSALNAACLVLSSSFPPSSRLGADDVEKAITHSRPEDAFSLFARIAEGDLAAALSALDAVLDDRKGDANQIIAALVWSFRRLLRIHEAVDAGERFEDVCLREQARSKTAQRQLREALRRYEHRDCLRIITALSETEAFLRTNGAAPSRQILQLLVDAIVTRKGAGLPFAGWTAEGFYPYLQSQE